MNTRLLGLTRIPFFLPLAAATLMLGVAMSFTAPYLSLFSVEQADMSPLKLGVFMTVIAASGVVASAFAGKWSDRRGHHRELLLAALIASSLGLINPNDYKRRQLRPSFCSNCSDSFGPHVPAG